MRVKEFLKLLDNEEFKIKVLKKLEQRDLSFFEQYDIHRHGMENLIKKLNIKVLHCKKIWYTNGVEDIMLKDFEEVPKGFYKGRSNTVQSTLGTRRVNNGKDTILLKQNQTLPEGFVYGSLHKSTTGYICINNGFKEKWIKKEEDIPQGYILGRINLENYIKAAQKRRKYIYNNGIEEIKLLDSEPIPEGYILGKLPKLSTFEKQKREQEYYHSLGYISIKELSHPQFIAYVWYKNHTVLIEDVLHSKRSATYINKEYITLLDKYVENNYKKNYSKEESGLCDFIASIYSGQIIQHDRQTLKDTSNKYYEMDIYLPELKIGIEFNGIYWHSDTFLEKDYHYNKSKLAESLGIRLIHIYEDEWNEVIQQQKIKTLLQIALGKVETKIYARKCEVKQISNQEAKPFNNMYHLQGHRNAQVTYGLFYNNKLVQLMSFSKTRYNRNLKEDDSWEIIRGCPGGNNIVVGGVSKLFSHFIRENNPKEVFSYCDFNKFDGRGYEAIGMNFIGYTGPDLYWIIDRKRVRRNPSKHKELKEQSQGILWGAGSKKYILTLEEIK